MLDKKSLNQKVKNVQESLENLQNSWDQALQASDKLADAYLAFNKEDDSFEMRMFCERHAIVAGMLIAIRNMATLPQEFQEQILDTALNFWREAKETKIPEL